MSYDDFRYKIHHQTHKHKHTQKKRDKNRLKSQLRLGSVICETRHTQTRPKYEVSQFSHRLCKNVLLRQNYVNVKIFIFGYKLSSEYILTINFVITY